MSTAILAGRVELRFSSKVDTRPPSQVRCLFGSRTRGASHPRDTRTRPRSPDPARHARHAQRARGRRVQGFSRIFGVLWNLPGPPRIPFLSVLGIDARLRPVPPFDSPRSLRPFRSAIDACSFRPSIDGRARRRRWSGRRPQENRGPRESSGAPCARGAVLRDMLSDKVRTSRLLERRMPDATQKWRLTYSLFRSLTSGEIDLGCRIEPNSSELMRSLDGPRLCSGPEDPETTQSDGRCRVGCSL